MNRNSLRVRNWQDWEEICKYLMQYIVKKELEIDIQYVNYGRQGQKQYGIDLVPSLSSAPKIVAQCKYIERGALTWDTVKAEMKKTDEYTGSINCYFILTTGNRDTSVQDKLGNGEFSYTRSNGEKYQLHVVYWDDLSPSDFIPHNQLNIFFPNVYQNIPNKLSNSEYVAAVSSLKEFIPKVITLKNLYWLETWDFFCGYLHESDFSPFEDLFFEHDRTVHALDGIPEWLLERDRAEIAKTLPAGKHFFDALDEFSRSIKEYSKGDSLSDETQILSVKYLPNDFQQKIVREWKSRAEHLAQVYRRDILGQGNY